jgi:hypothetical protein
MVSVRYLANKGPCTEMAKRQRNNLVTASFHYLVKSVANEDDPDQQDEVGFTRAEFERVLNRIRDIHPLDETDPDIVAAIKSGRDLPFSAYEEAEPGLHFGDFDGAYYGQRYRNNRLGVVEAADLNMRGFHYLVSRLRDGKILVGTSYHGLYGDYGGLRSCFSYLLRGNHRVASKTLTSIAAEIGDGEPVSLKLTYRRAADRPERAPLFGGSGVIAITRSDFGDNFRERMQETARQVQGDAEQRKRALAEIVNRGELISLDEDDIVGCSAVVREDGRQRTVYLLGENSTSTKFFLTAGMNEHGIADRQTVKREMIRVMRERIMPLIR